MSTTNKRHPYMQLSNWINGSLAFWRHVPEGSLYRYNVEAYERELQESIKNEKKIANLSQLKNRNVV